MRIILDTNVFVSGIFFTGPPYQILRAWRDRKIELVVSAGILEEYRQVSDILGERFPDVDLGSLMDLVIVEATIVSAPVLLEQICADAEDDKFLACALAGNASIIVSGDKHLLDVSGYRDIRVLSPRSFIDEFSKSLS